MCFLLQGTRVWLSQSSVHIRPSRWDLRLMPDISQGSRIKPDGDQAGGKFKIRSKSKPGQGVFLLDSSKVKKHQLQIPGSQHGGRSTDSNRMRRDPIPWAASAVTHCTNTSTEGTPQCKATWKPWAQGQAPSDGTEEFTTHFQRAADNWSPQPSTGAVGIHALPPHKAPGHTAHQSSWESLRKLHSHLKVCSLQGLIGQTRPNALENASWKI